MSLHLSNVILHQLCKNDNDELMVNYRTQSLDNDTATEKLVAELHRVFNAKAGKGFGSFKSDSDVLGWLNALRKGEQDFYTFSQMSAQKLKNELIKYPFADEGILVFAEYQSLATHFLFIGLLPLNQSLKVTEGLDISATDYLDISKMDIAARIDLSSFETDKDSNRYLSYIKGRVGRKVSDFFLDFLQAEIGLDPKQQNLVLMQAVEDFCTDAKLEKEEAISYKKQVYDYCNDQIKSGDEVQVKELSGELPSGQDGTIFFEFTREHGHELEEIFPGNHSPARKVTKYVG
ncbi:nucleoid-associated protein YejK, partial [Vibrio sp. V29_P1S30P107]|uniref:nucleoid-associated protein YejK n=1 Tax=Vibrio sp. V29_P1S30P107 TaxID=1938681 RepID=UPI001373062A